MRIKARLSVLRHRIQSSAFIKSVLTLSSGTAVRIGVTVAGMPIIGRIYSPAAMGDYELIVANAGVIQSVACLGMMTSFMLPEKDEEARGLSRLVTYSALIITTAAVLSLWLCSDFYRIFQTEEVSYSLSLTVLWSYIIISIVNGICSSYVNRRRFYGVLFWNPIVSIIIQVGSAIAFGILKWGFIGYTIAHILGGVASIIHLAFYANPYEKIDSGDFRSLPLLYDYRRFPLYQMPANLVETISARIPAQMLGTLYSASALGMYSMAIRILSIPNTLLSGAINRVYFREASERVNRGEDIGEFSFQIIRANIKLAILPISALMIFGERIFVLFLGEQWHQAGTFAALLGLYYLLSFCHGCLSGCYVLIRKNRNNLYVSIFSLAVNLILYALVLFFKPGVMICVFLMTLFNMSQILFTQGYFFWLAGFPLRKYISFLLIYIVLPAASCWMIRWLIW